MVSSTVRYTSLDSHRPTPSLCNWCVKLSRFKWKILSVIIIVILFLIIYACVHATAFHSDLFCFEPDTTRHQVIGPHFSPHVKHTQRRLPHSIIIGARKAGTRALLAFLSLHPLVQISSSEVHFFDDDENYTKGLDWYRKRMPYTFRNQITMEKTPKYFTEEKVPKRVYDMNSSIKLLLILRDPVQRAISDYHQLLENKRSRHRHIVSFEDSIKLDNGEINKNYRPVRRSIYFRYMQHWLEYFHLQQFHIVDGDKLAKNPYPELVLVENFLGLPNSIQKESFYYNETKGFYCVKKLGNNRTCLAPSKGRKLHRLDVSPHVINELRQFYKPYNEKFFNLIGRTFEW